MKTFEELGVSPEIRKTIEGMGCESPMPVQEEVIPYLLGESNDVVALTQTGTGKTAAFSLPLIQKTNIKNRIPQSLVLYPTHKLCLQVAGDLNDYSRYTDRLKVLPIYGGSSIDSQIHNLKQGMHVIIATPGRLLDLMERKTASLATVTNVVMDEADEMLNMGFTESMGAILADVPQERNALLFSATISPEIARISKNCLHDTKGITVGRKDEGVSNVERVVCTVHAKDRYTALKRIVDYYPQIYGVISCRTRKETQEIAGKLMQEGYNADPLHGEFSQAQCDAVMQKFRIRNLQMLVVTDIAARGLDVDDLIHVIDYGLSDDTESYTYRNGRAGCAGKIDASIATINLREEGRMREIGRTIGKKFIADGMPTDKQICEKQLFKVIDGLEKVKANKENINDFMPKVYRRLEWLSKEDLIKCTVLHELNRFVDHCHNREKVEVSTSSRSERAVKSYDGRDGRQAEPGFTRLFINLDKMDNFSLHELITLLNNSTHGRVELGHIDLMKNFLFFEVEEKQAQNVVKALNRADWNGHKVTVEITRKEAPAERRGRGKRDEGGDKGGKGGNTTTSADHKDKGGAGKDGEQADTRKAQKPSREERGYSAARGPRGEDEWKQFFRGAESGFSGEGWARRKLKKS